jgi:hypothetical protein
MPTKAVSGAAEKRAAGALSNEHARKQARALYGLRFGLARKVKVQHDPATGTLGHDANHAHPRRDTHKVGRRHAVHLQDDIPGLNPGSVGNAAGFNADHGHAFGLLALLINRDPEMTLAELRESDVNLNGPQRTRHGSKQQLCNLVLVAGLSLILSLSSIDSSLFKGRNLAAIFFGSFRHKPFSASAR